MKWGREYNGCGEYYNVEKKQYHLFCNIKAVGQQWKNLGVQQIIRPPRNVLADIIDHLADNIDPLAENFDYFVDKNVREKIPTWLKDMLYAKVFPQLLLGRISIGDKGSGDENFGDENQDLKKLGGEEYQVHP